VFEQLQAVVHCEILRLGVMQLWARVVVNCVGLIIFFGFSFLHTDSVTDCDSFLNNVSAFFRNRYLPNYMNIFTHDSIYAIPRICYGNSVHPSVCLSICLSVTRVHCIQTAEHIIEILSLSDRPIILVFCNVRITKMLMGAGFASEASEKNFFPAPPGGGGGR